MSLRNMFHGEFPFHSNDSLDTQITASIDRGDFYLSVLSLIALIAWSIYLLFYNSRVLGLVVSIVLRRFIKKGFIRFGSISLSVLAGKLMVRDFAYMNDDYSVKCCYAIIVFNYWTRFHPLKKASEQRRCLYLYLYGLDLHLYNRTAVYERLQKLFKCNTNSQTGSLFRSSVESSPAKGGHELLNRIGSGKVTQAADVFEEDGDNPAEQASGPGFMDLFWSHARRLFPAVKFNLELTKICAGNHLLPRAAILNCTRLIGMYTLQEPTCQTDKYQHEVTGQFINFTGSLVPVVEYSGQHAVEEPPTKGNDSFNLFHLGRGSLTYIQDEPGLISYEPEQLLLSGGNVTMLRTWPSWGMAIQVTKECRLYYGPWADRQRDIIWRFFFPQSFEPAKVSEPPVVGHPRVAQKFVFELKTATDISLDLVFTQNSAAKSMRLTALADSTLKFSIPWLIGPEGFVTTFRTSLVQARLTAQYLWPNLLQTKQLNLDLRMHYPREWNMPQSWDVDVDAKNAQFTLLFDFKNFFKALIDDWSRGYHPDLLHFVPCTYKFKISARNLNFILLTNEYNWVSSSMENSFLGVCGRKLLFTFELPFVDFLPDLVPIVYSVQIDSVEVRMSLPETSTLLYVIQETHRRLKLADRSGRFQSANPFHLHDEVIDTDKAKGETIHRYWIDCARAPRASLRIAYIYHPSPWTSEYWCFLPQEMRPQMPSAKPSTRHTVHTAYSRHKKYARGHLNSHLRSHSDSDSQSELEELVLRGLRPEGSQAQGPTEEDLLKGNFDAGLFAPDTVDVHLHVPHAQLVFYGVLLRHFLQMKDNYFGCYQKPVDFDGPPMSADEYLLGLSHPSTSASPQNTSPAHGSLAGGGSTLVGVTSVSGGRKGEKTVLDPRMFRPILVRLSLEFHNVQVHMPVQGSSANSPCPTAFVDCLGVELDKRWHETKVQLMISPILLCVYDQCKESRPKPSSPLSVGRVQLLGFSLRGLGMFSHADLPVAAETLEYAWLMELNFGRLTGQLTAPQVTVVVNTVKEFIFGLLDKENQLICSRDFEICQHGTPQACCPVWPSTYPESPCPGEMSLKYRMLRITADGVDVGIVEVGTCMSVQLDPFRMTQCNMHSAVRCNGLFLILTGVRLKQFIRPVAGEFRVGSKEKAVKLFVDTEQQRIPWLEAGCLSLGPIHVNVAKAAENPELPLWQLEFLRHHDTVTKRLWFLWSPHRHVQGEDCTNGSGSIQLIDYTPPSVQANCGCYGHCSFFGSNQSGCTLYDELITGLFRQRALFPPRTVYGTKPGQNLEKASTETNASIGFPLFSNPTPQDNYPGASVAATSFGESLLVPQRLMHELHNPSVCLERFNGLLLMREEAVAACTATKSSSEPLMNLEHCCDECESSDENSCIDSGSTHSYLTSVSGLSTDMLTSGGDDVAYVNPRTHRHHHRSPIDTGASSVEPESRTSSMSELLMPPDSTEEDEPVTVEKISVPNTSASRTEAPVSILSHGLSGRLPSDLSLNSLIGSLASSSTTSTPNSERKAVHSGTDNPTFPSQPLSPPTPPPRQFIRRAAEISKPCSSQSTDGLKHSAATIRRTSTAESRTDYDAFEKFVDLRSQLNRPITDSGLLRSAYSHHLSVYSSRGGWCLPVRIRHRWHLCKRIYPGEAEAHPTSSERSECLQIPSSIGGVCQIGNALAPQFQLTQQGFSPRSIIMRPVDTSSGSVKNETAKMNSSQGTSSHDNATVWLQGSVDLLLSPLFTEALERYLNILSPVLCNISPSAVTSQMHSSCVSIKASLTKETEKLTAKSKSSPFDPVPVSHAPGYTLQSDTFSPALVRADKPAQENPTPEGPPSTSLTRRSLTHRISIPVDLFSSHTCKADQSSGIAPPVKQKSNITKVDMPPIPHSATEKIPPVKPLTKITEAANSPTGLPSDRRSSAPGRSCIRPSIENIVSGRLGAVSVERINVCFLQIYAVENLVHLDSLRSGLHDLTCASLLALCVDFVSFEIMSCHRIQGMLPEITATSPSVAESDASSACSDEVRRPLLQGSVLPGLSRFGTNVLSAPTQRASSQRKRMSDIDIRPDANQPGGQLVSYPSMPESPFLLANPDTVLRKQHSRQPSAPPVLTNSWGIVENFAQFPSTSTQSAWLHDHHGAASSRIPTTDAVSTDVINSNVASAPTEPKKLARRPSSLLGSNVPLPAVDRPISLISPARVKLLSELPHLNQRRVRGSELACQLSVRRIHGQLRRLTRCGQFNSEVLLTAIPFESSKTFFMFDSDVSFLSLTSQPSTSSSTVWDEQSTGWIMYECGLERLSFSCDLRDGFDDLVGGDNRLSKEGADRHLAHERSSVLTVVPSAEAETNPAHGKPPSSAATKDRPSSPSKHYSFKLPQTRAKRQSSAITQEVSSTRSGDSRDMNDGGNTNANVAESRPLDTTRNGFLSHLRVATVWLNFPSPKRLPNKRRIELIRSDWNLLSTAAPSIKAWIDPCDRLITVCRQLQAGMERRFLAVTACLMAEAVNSKSVVFAEKGQLMFYHLGSKELTGYARHRTPAAHALRFDPSCQLFIILRRYLFAMGNLYGLGEADRMLNDWLSDSLVPHNELLQCGILSLTREWRFLAEILALTVEDLKQHEDRKQMPVSARRRTRLLSEHVLVRGSRRVGTDSQQPVITPKTPSVLTLMSGVDTKPVGSALEPSVHYTSDPSPALTSRLLRMVVGPVSPSPPATGKVYRRLWSKDRQIPPVLEDQNVDEPSIDDSQIGLFDSRAPEPNLESSWDVPDSGVAPARPGDNGLVIQNPILRRFLHDAKVPVSDSSQPQPAGAGPVPPHPQKGSQNEVKLKRSSSAIPIKSHFTPADLDTDNVETPEVSGRPLVHETEKPRPYPQGGDLTAADLRISTADFEQVAHLSAQFQHVAYIQRVFSPLLESVGLSVKGIRRTTLMKKFGGYVSADGLLQTLQIEIVSSARNPLVSRSTVTSNTPASATSSRAPAPLHQGISTGRQLAFLCRNFASKLTLRDVVDPESQKRHRPGISSKDQLNIMPTTTKIDMMFSVDFLRQHVNLPLLRLTQQFVTMAYVARDAQKSSGLRKGPAISATPMMGPLGQKQDSKGSSDGTDGTLRSHSSAYVRLGEGSMGSAGSTGSATHGRLNDSALNDPLRCTEQHSSDVTSSSSVEREPTVTDTPLPVAQPMSGLPISSGTVPTPATMVTPACWRRLFNYVELYTTVPKTRTVVRRALASAAPSSAMPTITEEDRDHLSRPASATSPLKVKVASDIPLTSVSETSASPAVVVTRPTILGRRLLSTVTYQPLNEDVEIGVSPQISQLPVSTAAANLPPGPTLSVATTVERGTTPGISPSVASRDFPDGFQRASPMTPATARFSKGACTPSSVFEQFTYPWLYSERVPLRIFVTVNIHQMAVTAVLSELNLTAGVRNMHASFAHSSHVRGRGSFTERSSSQSLSLHYGEGQLQLTERLPPIIQEVVRVRLGHSHALLSGTRSRHTEHHTLLINAGPVSITLPHHPVRLHGVMQRQAKRISSTVSELLGGSPSLRNQLHPWNMTDASTSSVSRIATTPTTSSTTTTTASDGTVHAKSRKNHIRPISGATGAATATTSPTNPWVFGLIAVSQGLTVDVALHPTLTAVYHIDPVYFTGQLGPRGFAEFTVTEHSLTLRSLRPPVNFPRSIKIQLPRIMTSAIRRVSSGGKYARGQRKEPMLTYGLSAEQGLYVDIQVTIDTLEQTLTTDMLNYIVIVVKLFMKEINEVIQKMAGEEQRGSLHRFRGSRLSQMPSYRDSGSIHLVGTHAESEADGVLSRAARGKTKFTVRIRMKEIQLMATARSGALKLEAKKIEVELTNRVSQTSLDSSLLHGSSGAGTRGDNVTATTSVASCSHARPSNLNLRSSNGNNNNVEESDRHCSPTSASRGRGDSLFIYAAVASLSSELGYLDQDVFYNERSPEFKTVAFFRMSIALRSLLADEEFSMSSSSSPTESQAPVYGEHDAFLISVNRPTLWMKPFTFDRGILMWMVYKSEFAKWNEHMEYLASMTTTEPSLDSQTRLSPVDRHPRPPCPSREKPVLLEPISATPSPVTRESSCETAKSDVIHRHPRPKSSSLDKLPSSTLFLQLNVEDLGVCLPVNILQTNSQTMEADSRTALVLTLDRSRISACYRDSLVSQSQFTDFCLRFDDEFNVGSDDWKPDWKRSGVDVKGKRYCMILNACVVPSGTFSVFWRDTEKRAQWHLGVQWQMQGLVIHLDDNIGRRLKALISILTRITGYDGAAPLLPTSAEEEEEYDRNHTVVHRDLSDVVEAKSNMKQDSSAAPRAPGTMSENAPEVDHSKPATVASQLVSDIASLDRYRPSSRNKIEGMSREQLSDLSQVRSMELNKHKQEVLEAQYCQAFKRRKWSTLRRMKGTHVTRSPILQHSAIPLNGSKDRTQGSQFIDQTQISSNPRSSHSSMPEGFRPFDDPTTVMRNTLRAQTCTEVSGQQCGSGDFSTGRHTGEGTRGSLVSRDDSIYFDVETGERGFGTLDERHADAVSSYDSASGGTETVIGEKQGDLWFDPLSAQDSMFEFSRSFDFGELNPEEDNFVSDDAEDATETYIAEPSSQKNGHHANESGQQPPPPPPPPRRSLTAPPESTHTGNGHEDPEVKPKLRLEIDVQIHVDSGCCVLHPRLPIPESIAEDSRVCSPHSGTMTGPSAYPNPLLPETTAFPTPGCIAAPLPTDFGGRPSVFTNNDLFNAYLSRYKRHLLQDIRFLSTDLSVFYLPAVDIGLHYNSMTEMNFLAGGAPLPSGIHSTTPRLSDLTAKSVPSTNSRSSYRQTSDTAAPAHILADGIEYEEDVTIRNKTIQGGLPPRLSSNVSLRSTNVSASMAPVTSGLKKQTDLYISCFLQKLPKELIVHPALLDFLEQALENIPLVADWDYNDSGSLSSVESKSGDEDKTRPTSTERGNRAPSSTSLPAILSETFPVHTVVHLHVQPSTVRLLCLPTSRMQCLMVSPFLDVVFSTKRDQNDHTDPDHDPEAEQSSSVNPSRRGTVESTDSRSGTNSYPSRGPIQLSIQPDGTAATLRLPPNPTSGDIVSEGGLCMTAILREFRFSIFHPYGDSRVNRSDWDGDSFTLVVRDIQLNLSRATQTSIVQLSSVRPAVDDLSNSFTILPARSESSRDGPTPPSGRWRPTPGVSTAPLPTNDTWGLHRDVQFSCILDIGAAVFTCDTKRTLEILDIPNAWYRSSLARRLFLGNDEITTDLMGQSIELDAGQSFEDDLPLAAKSSVSPDAAVTSELVITEDKEVITSEQKPPISTAEMGLTDTRRPRYYSMANPVSPDNHSVADRKRRRPTQFQTSLSGGEPDATTSYFSSSSKAIRSKTMGSAVPDERNLPSKATTLGDDHGATGSRGGSLKLASWHALPIFCVRLKKFDLNLSMGSAMGLTRLTIDRVFSGGRISLTSAGRKNAMLSGGLSSCQFHSEGGGVGGELCLRDAEARVRLDQDPSRDPHHSLECRIGGFQLRIEYMTTNIMLMRVSALNCRLHDEWRLRDAARQFVGRWKNTFPGPGFENSLISSSDVPVTPIRPTSSGERRYSTFASESEPDVGAPPVYIKVVGEINWDQAQTAIVRTTTPDLLRSVQIVRKYFEEQVREGRLTLAGQGGSFGMFLSSRERQLRSAYLRVHGNRSDYQTGTDDNKSEDDPDRFFVDRLLQRHWQRLMYESLKMYVREQLAACPDLKSSQVLLDLDHSLLCRSDDTYPVLSGSFQLSGRSLGIACYAGSFRSAPDWAIFNIQYPTACFETEAQREVPESSEEDLNSSEADGWVNVRQVLSFDLGSHPEFQPQMAYVLRVRRGRQPTMRNPPVLTIAEWMEFSFRGADNTMSQFPVEFPDSFTSSPDATSFSATTTSTSGRGSLNTVTEEPDTVVDGQVVSSTNVATKLGSSWKSRLSPKSSLKSDGKTLGIIGSLKDSDQNQQKSEQKKEQVLKQPKRPNPLKPPTEAEILFIVPSISLRITSDQRQTMAQPTLSSLPSVESVSKQTSQEQGTSAKPAAPSGSVTGTSSETPQITKPKEVRSWIYRHITTPAKIPETEKADTPAPADDPNDNKTTAAARKLLPSVKISFQTDFHGFVQLGLIDVPWLPTLISSYLSERLHDYEIASASFPSTPPSADPQMISGNDIITRLRALATTSSPMVQDARTYEIIHWSLSPECRWLLATSIGVPAFDKLLESIGFHKARVTIPKWLQRGVMDHLDLGTSILLKAITQLVAENRKPKQSATKKASHVVRGIRPVSMTRGHNEIMRKSTTVPVAMEAKEQRSVVDSIPARPCFSLIVDEEED
ncbi:unnamed protein product [Calicophoron daubneyi]|uniref:Bridge-like lipid transfer protein family member 1 C-terminal domain-containing protein n=1 Tax=Calicophoron daubneyi TaxID=300641 RepID=A0AAV2TE09_CALDB